MQNFLKQIFIVFCLVVILILPFLVFAQAPLDKLRDVAGEEGAGYADYQDDTFDNVIGAVINSVLGILGMIFLILMIYAGYNWMTASGEEEKITKAKSTIYRAIIGFIIVAGAFAIWNFIAMALL